MTHDQAMREIRTIVEISPKEQAEEAFKRADTAVLRCFLELVHKAEFQKHSGLVPLVQSVLAVRLTAKEEENQKLNVKAIKLNWAILWVSILGALLGFLAFILH